MILSVDVDMSDVCWASLVDVDKAQRVDRRGITHTDGGALMQQMRLAAPNLLLSIPLERKDNVSRQQWAAAAATSKHNRVARQNRTEAASTSERASQSSHQLAAAAAVTTNVRNTRSWTRCGEVASRSAQPLLPSFRTTHPHHTRLAAITLYTHSPSANALVSRTRTISRPTSPIH